MYKVKQYKEEWKNLYIEANRQWYNINRPTVYNSSFWFVPSFPKVKTANGLRKFICNYLTWMGHHGEPSNNMGRPIEKFKERYNIFSGKVEKLANGIEWQKGAGIKGTSDVKGHIRIPSQKYSIAIYLEIKIGKDSQRDEQIKYENIVTSSGSLYCIIKTPEDFISFFKFTQTL